MFPPLTILMLSALSPGDLEQAGGGRGIRSDPEFLSEELKGDEQSDKQPQLPMQRDWLRVRQRRWE